MFEVVPVCHEPQRMDYSLGHLRQKARPERVVVRDGIENPGILV